MEESRRYGDFAMVGAAVLLTLDTARQCTRVAVVLCGVGSVPHHVAAAPALLLGRTVEAARLRDVAQAAASEIEPESDLHASAEFRRHLSRVLIQRAVHQAAERATV
jgi:CO/xanthine dehydrogenase FAD-binding subunit